MFCEESLEKSKFIAFPKRAGPRILSRKSVDYFGTSEHCMQMSFVMSMRIVFGDD